MDPMLKHFREFINQTGFAVWIGKRKERSLNFQFCMIFAYRSTCYFAPLNMVYAELELEESVSELMAVKEVRGWGRFGFGNGRKEV
jgi:hypothetical protein